MSFLNDSDKEAEEEQVIRIYAPMGGYLCW